MTFGFTTLLSNYSGLSSGKLCPNDFINTKLKNAVKINLFISVFYKMFAKNLLSVKYRLYVFLTQGFNKCLFRTDDIGCKL